eukprot:scaffold42734_cov53-Phaeocystis_antarctica.AAC.2
MDRRQPDPLGDVGRLLTLDAAHHRAGLQLPRLHPVRTPADALPHVGTRLVAADVHLAVGIGVRAHAMLLAVRVLAVVGAAVGVGVLTAA